MSGPSLRHPPQRWSLLSPDALELELEPDDAQCKFARSVLIPVVANLPQGAVGASWH